MGVIYSVFLIGLLLFFSYRYAWWKRPVNRNYPRILMYHMIREPIRRKKFNSLRVSPKHFEQQLHYLKKHGWTSMTMGEAFERRFDLPPKTVVITFDDGYRDNITQALPLLERYGFKATIYLVNDRHGRDWSVYRKAKNKGSGLEDEPKLSDEDVRALIKSNLVEIGAHTVTHANLTVLDTKAKQKEICDSKYQIETLFGSSCRSFAYPFGLYDDETKEIVAQCGYTHAVTTKKGIGDLVTCDPYEIPRITISGKDSLFTFWLKLRTGKRGVRK